MRKGLAVAAVAAAGLVLFGLATPGSAQTPRRAYAAAIFGGYHVDSDHVDGTSASVGIAAGWRLTSRLDADVELIRPTGGFFREYTGTSTSFAAQGASREEIERLAVVTTFSYERRVLNTFSGGIVFHGRSRGRWAPLFYAGVTNQHVMNVSRRVPIKFPEGVDPARLARIVPEEERHVRNLGALTGGIGVRFTLTPNLSVVPDLRIDYGSIGDEIENAIRPSIRLAWSF
jgi:hypothetical protein